MRIIGVDIDPDVAGSSLVDSFVVVPRSDDPAFYSALLTVCKRYSVGAVLPTHSSEIAIFGSFVQSLAEKGIGTFLAAPGVVDLCNDKIEMDRAVREMGVRTPMPIDDSLEGSFPFFARQTEGSGSTLAQIVSSSSELEKLRSSELSFQYSELITGVEYTVDILALRDSTLAVCSVRERLDVRAGQTVKGVTSDMPELVELSQRICTGIGYVGPGNIQFMVDDSGPVFIEFNPRFAAGGLGLTVAAGGNIPLLTLELALGREISPVSIQSGVKLARYYRDFIIMPEGSN